MKWRCAKCGLVRGSQNPKKAGWVKVVIKNRIALLCKECTINMMIWIFGFPKNRSAKAWQLLASKKGESLSCLSPPPDSYPACEKAEAVKTVLSVFIQILNNPRFTAKLLAAGHEYDTTEIADGLKQVIKDVHKARSGHVPQHRA